MPGATNCGKKARKKICTFGFVMFMMRPRRQSCTGELGTARPCRRDRPRGPCTPGKIKIGGARELDRHEECRNGRDDGCKATGREERLQHQTGHEAEHDGDAPLARRRRRSARAQRDCRDQERQKAAGSRRGMSQTEKVMMRACWRCAVLLCLATVRKCTGQKNPQRATGRGLGLPHCGETASFILRELHRLSQEVMMQHGSSREKRKCLLESS